ncbi:YfiR family protein [uncultured Dechloromonas sp.]|uniref:YfiR family protein n=1 Tax=uncultured Dechloromonas sp. TaxID=171719 RepID=UPI0025DDF501|nr:YfiR family protein [uncultured Dechloromonas sp.]
MRALFLLVSLWLAGIVLADSGGERPDSVAEADMKAAYIYNFGAFTEWPESNRISFNICTLGDDRVGRSLKRYEGKLINNRRVAVARLSSLAAIADCQILFIGDAELPKLGRIAHELGQQAVLTVADAPVLPQVGMVIALQGQRLAFEVNLDYCKRANLKPQSNLLRLARSVRKSD